jgi:hypothetical protein
MHPRIASLGRFLLLLLPAGRHRTPASPPSQPGRRRAGQLQRDGDRLLVAFGRDGTTFTDEVWSFNLRNNAWTRLSS